MKLLMAAALAAFFVHPVKEVRRTVPLATDGRVYLTASRGTVEITAWDRPAVEVYARIEPRNILGSQKACIEETQIRLDSWPASLRIAPAWADIDTRIPRLLAALFGACTEQPLVRYRISAPRHAELIINDGESAISITGFDGTAHVTTHRGTVTVSGGRGRLDLRRIG